MKSRHGRDAKRKSLAGARSGFSDDVAARQYRNEGLSLDGGEIGYPLTVWYANDLLVASILGPVRV